MEVALHREAGEAIADGVDPVRGPLGGEHAEGVHEGHGVDVALFVHFADEVEEVVQIGAGAVGREEADLQSQLMREVGGLHRHVDRALILPLLAVLEQVLAAHHLGDDAVYPAVLGELHVLLHAAHEAVDLALQTAALDLRADLPDRVGVLFERGRGARLDAMHTGLCELEGEGYLLILRQDDARLLLTVAQCGVEDLDVLGELQLAQHLRVIVAGTDPPFSVFMKTHTYASFL